MSKQISVIEYYDRKTGEMNKEIVMGDALIKWAYRSLAGKIIAPFLFSSSFVSKLIGYYFDSKLSKPKIDKAIQELKIDESEFAVPKEEYSSFNDFFTRKLKDDARPYSQNDEDFSSPADGRVLVYNEILPATLLKVKGVEDSLNNLFNKEITDFDNGKVAVIRLCPADYHRYHFPCDGTVIEQVKVSGKYHSVNPVALEAEKRVFCQNKREYTIIETTDFKKVAFMEVGAFGVGGIHQTFTGTKIEKMQEKGYFDFGGSTVVLVFQKDAIRFCDDLIRNSEKGIETLIKAGETIAHKPN